MSQDDGRKDTRRRAKDTPPAPTTATPPSLDTLPTGQPVPKSVVAQEEAPAREERQVIDSAALLAELNSLDAEELGRLMSAGAPKRYRTGDRISGEVVRIHGFTAFIDIGAKSEAALGTEDMEEQPKIGDIIEAFVVRVDGGGISIAQKLGGGDADIETMEEAMESGAPIEGRVVSHNAGGFTVRIGSVSAFCPRSHIDRIVPEELDGYVDQTYTFRVIDIEGSKVVISRRVLLDEALEESAAALWDTLAPGDSVEGIVANVRDFGVFVDLGGIQGLVSMRELGWEADESTLPKRGESVSVRVIDVDKARKRVSLSMKDPSYSPWGRVGADFIEGDVYDAKVVRLTDFGAFLRLAPGLEGLCHISSIAARRIEQPGDVLTVGEMVQVRLMGIDHTRKRLELSIKDATGESQSSDGSASRRPAPAAPASLGTMADLFGGLSLGGGSKPAAPKRSKKKSKKRR